MGIGSIAPDSFGLKNRRTQNSLVDKVTHEKVHALRASEIALALLAFAAWSQEKLLHR